MVGGLGAKDEKLERRPVDLAVAQQLLGGGGREIRDALFRAGDVALGDAGFCEYFRGGPTDIRREFGVGDDAHGQLAANCFNVAQRRVVMVAGRRSTARDFDRQRVEFGGGGAGINRVGVEDYAVFVSTIAMNENRPMESNRLPGPGAFRR